MMKYLQLRSVDIYKFLGLIFVGSLATTFFTGGNNVTYQTTYGSGFGGIAHTIAIYSVSLSSKIMLVITSMIFVIFCCALLISLFQTPVRFLRIRLIAFLIANGLVARPILSFSRASSYYLDFSGLHYDQFIAMSIALFAVAGIIFWIILGIVDKTISRWRRS